METLHDYAVYEARTVPEELGSHFTKKVRGWWMKDKQEDVYLGKNKSEAEEILELKYMIKVK